MEVVRSSVLCAWLAPLWHWLRERYEYSLLAKILRGIALGWREIVGDAGEIVSIDHYGSSAPGTALFEEYGFTGDNVAERARRALARTRG